MANLPKLIHTHQIFFGFQYNGTKEHKPSGWVCSLSISTSLIQSIRNVWLTRRCILHQCVIWSQHSGQCVIIIIIPVNNRQQLVCQIADAEPLSFFSNGHWVGNVQRYALCCIAFANTMDEWMNGDGGWSISSTKLITLVLVRWWGWWLEKCDSIRLDSILNLNSTHRTQWYWSMMGPIIRLSASL